MSKSQTRYQEGDPEAMALMEKMLDSKAKLQIEMHPFQGFALVSMLQLSLRFPKLSPFLRTLATDLVRLFQSDIVTVIGDPELDALIEKGFDPKQVDPTRCACHRVNSSV